MDMSNVKINGNCNQNMKREKWSSNLDFFVSITSSCVGLGNVWRFPYLCYLNGGGAFMVPYIICVIAGGIPLFFLEISLGQFTSAGGLKAWKMICPLMQGIGAASACIQILASIYYIIIMVWTLYYIFASFTRVLPWSHCDNYWNTESCFVKQGRFNVSVVSDNKTDMINYNTSLLTGNTTLVTFNDKLSTYTDATVEFWENKVLQISSGIEEIGNIKWDLCLCLLLTWIIVFCCVCKGIKISGKIMYFTAVVPYLLLIVLFIRGITLSGSVEGIKYYLIPDFNRLKDYRVWSDAGSQVFFSYSLCFGSMIAMGSYNKFNHNCWRDSILLACLNSGTSFFAGLVIFCTLGFMSHQQGVSIKDVAESGPGLAFIVYPKAISEMPLSPMWSFLFFVMILLLGLGTEVIGFESFTTAVFDQFPYIFKTKQRKFTFYVFLTILCFLAGLSMITNGGMYVFQLFDFYACSRMILFIGFFESITIAYLYGVRTFYKDIKLMLGFSIGPYMKISWLVSCPVYTIITFVLSVYSYSEITYNKTYRYPAWAIGIGWTMALLSIVTIPIFAVWKLCKESGSLTQRLKASLQPSTSDNKTQCNKRLPCAETEEQQPMYEKKLEQTATKHNV